MREPQEGQAGFRSESEFKEVLDRALTSLSGDPELGARLRAIGIRHRLRVTDLDVAVNVDLADGISWSFDEDPGWAPDLDLAMTSEVANRYLQGEENIVLAVARKRIVASAREARCILRWYPMSRPLFDAYRELVERDYPHLAHRELV